MTTINDVVLIHLEDTPVSFARVESILPDPKKDWYQIKLLMLQVPLQVVTWILKDTYINGDDFFMNGKKMRLERVECPIDAQSPQSNANPPTSKTNEKTEKDMQGNGSNKSNIISFADLKNNPS
ncbi:MAG: hypothetical protein CSA29_00190 [Desulfobacterales bacterium]|nr:MAG: hypothetical protein CSA29_00190 [Desulfobacterales bacterium]